ncbi:sensor histidine kinase [Nocardiopsis potens]|uniref:sensor histidine kinase n=1 Tax=Nocardiopsis potens TaxID=1246458 RepID=UPI00034D1BAF|nr:nitrate- and nitrite sensing domain-containing protein [Nocardiopsis potens]
MAPTSALVVLWLGVSGTLFANAAIDVALADGNEKYLTPSAVALTAVMQERSVTVGYLEHPDELADELTEAQEDSDEKMGTIITDYDELKPVVPEPSAERITTLQERYSGIHDLRAQVRAGSASREDVMEFYGGVTTAAADLFDDLSRNGNDTQTIGHGVSATSVFRAVDELGMADAQLVRSFSEDELSHPDMHAFVQEYGAFRSRMEQTADFLGPDQREQYRELVESEEYERLQDYVTQIMERPAVTETDPVTGEIVERFPMPVSKEDWEAAFDPVFEEITSIGANEATYAGEMQGEAAYRSIGLAALGSAGVAVLVVLAFIAANRSARRLVERLHRLRDDSHELTEKRLPGIMERLRRNEPVQVDAELSSLEANQSADEIGQVAHAFDTAQRTAVEAAVRQAELREGVNRVFLSIAHRSQTLIHRQLRLLDRMEREQEDPAQLTELFKLDHLATRSRRNAENLLILGGENPGRTWHRPMPLVDVVRGSISESGDYTRVQRNHIARVSVVGPAVADVIHLVAELVDNATTFSPPHTRVMLSAEQVPNGVSIEIEDRGLGMQEDEFEAANALLSDPPEFDVMRLNEKMRLGLFVVSRLARRHDIKVWLRSSPYGGVQAIVLLPPEIIADAAPLPPGRPEEDTGEQPVAIGSLARKRPESGGDLLKTGATGENPAVPAAGGDSAGRKEPGGKDGGEQDGKKDVGKDAAAPAPSGDRPPLPRRGRNASAGNGSTTASGLPRRGAAPADGSANGSLNGSAGGAPEAPGQKSGANGSGGAPEGSAPAAPTDASGRPALPKRTPQTNLAPQLAESCPAMEEDRQAAPASHDPERSEKLRRNMAAFQAGTLRGRKESRAKQGGNDTEDTEKDSRP